ncbi:MAG TPA: dienelactone hydrolase family protein [Steroidobacteraceae bacterium]|nr:dienelactone hydrolase family protein [Steroidobacteraceae bacterium]
MGSYIEIPVSKEGRMPAYLVEASGRDARPGIVVLQEIFGVNANMRQTAEVFATLGYDVIVPDLFWRQEPRIELDPSSPADRARAMTLKAGLDEECAVQDALAAVAHLQRSGRASGRAGAVGYCLGGKLAYLLATHAELSAAVSYYGVAIHGALDRAAALCAPLLVHIATNDDLCPPAAQKAIHDALGPRPNVQIIDHAAVGHAFARRGSTAFRSEAAERADSATAAFLTRHLKAPK